MKQIDINDIEKVFFVQNVEGEKRFLLEFKKGKYLISHIYLTENEYNYYKNNLDSNGKSK